MRPGPAAAAMERYMRDRFSFLGAKASHRREIQRRFWKREGLPATETMLVEVVTTLWDAPFRELHYAALETIECFQVAHGTSAGFIDVLDQLLVRHSWWDTVDVIAPRLAGLRHFPAYPDQAHSAAGRWIRDENVWRQRAALLFQLKWKEKTDPTLLFSLIERRSDSGEFFVQKAAGWALREYAKTDPDAVWEFVAGHDLPALTRKEALKHLSSA